MNHHTRSWSLQDAKAKFSEVVRLAVSEGPQLVTVHGKPAVLIEPAPGVVEKFKGLSALEVYRLLDKGMPVDFEPPKREPHSFVRNIDLP